MKILLATGIYPPDIGGPATYTRTLARELVKRGHGVSIICYSDKVHLDFEEKSKEDFSVTRISREQSRSARYAEYEEKAYELAKDVDLVYLQGPVSEGVPASRAAKRAGKPTVVKIVGDYAWEVYQGAGGKELLDEFVMHRHWMQPKIFAIEGMERQTVKYASRIITPSQYLKGIVEKWGVSSEKIEVIYNEVQPLPEGMIRDEARKQFGVDGKRVLCTAVRAVPWKNIDFIIKLLPKLDQDIILVIAGDGPSLESWKAVAKLSGVEDRVRFLGKQDRKELGNWYRAADLFVLPSGYEGFPNVIPEAVSCGLPCLVSDKGGNPETKKMFKDQVTVLSYLDSTAWISAINSPVMGKDVQMTQNELHFDQMIKTTLGVLEAVLKTRKIL